MGSVGPNSLARPPCIARTSCLNTTQRHLKLLSDAKRRLAWCDAHRRLVREAAVFWPRLHIRRVCRNFQIVHGGKTRLRQTLIDDTSSQPAPLAGDDLRAEVADYLARMPVRFASQAGGWELLVPRHHPIRFRESAAAQLELARGEPPQIYEETTTLVLSYLIDRFDLRVLFDVGAGVGYFSRVAASHTRVGTRAYAFEMRSDRLQELRANISSDSFSDCITVQPAGVTDRHKGEVEIWYARGLLFEDRPENYEYREAWWRRLKFALRGDKSRSLSSTRALVTSIDHFVQSTGDWPSIIKIDVEGYEGKVLDGAKITLATKRPFVLLELHKDKKLRFGTRRERIAQRLFDLGYQALFFTDHENRGDCEVVEVGPDHPLLRRQETDLILFFHPTRTARRPFFLLRSRGALAADLTAGQQCPLSRSIIGVPPARASSVLFT